MQSVPLDVLYEDNHLLVVNKPAGLATQGSRPGEGSLVEVAKQYIKSRYGKPGNVYLGVVSRLDSLVTGVVVFARTSKAAARLNAQFSTSTTAKTYLAIVEQEPTPDTGHCLDWLLHDDAHRQVIVSSEGQPGARKASLNYEVLQKLAIGWLVQIQLETGRKHQIRVQLSSRGWPIVGDRKYSARRAFPAGIALHARRLEILHPTSQERLAFEAPLPDSWPRNSLDF